mgnify:CR=1 FL=1
MTEKIRLDYQMFRWGPLLVKFKIPDDMRKKLLTEANASHKDFEKNLAGVITKEVGFRDIEMFKPFFHTVFEMYADAQAKWAPEVGSTIETFKQQYLIEALWANFQGPGDFNPPHDHGSKPARATHGGGRFIHGMKSIIYGIKPARVSQRRGSFRCRTRSCHGEC